MIIRPYSDTTAFDSGGPLEPTAAKFPCCKLFLPCTDAAGTALLLDKISGQTMNFTGTAAGSGAGYINITSASPADVNLPVSIAVGNLAAMLVVSCDVGTTAAIALKAAAGSGAFTTSPFGNSINDGTTSHALGTSTADSETHALLIRGSAASSPVGHRTTSSIYTAGTPVVATPASVPNMTKLVLNESIPTTQLYYLAFFVFANGFPTNKFLQDMITWTHGHARSTTTVKGIYPGLKGVA